MNRIKMLRNEAHLSLRELSSLTKITHSTLSWLEKEQQPLRQHHIERLCAFFNCTADFLLGKSDSGIGVYFKDDFKMINYKQYIELTNDVGCDISIIETDMPDITFRVWNNEVALSKKQVYRYIKVNSTQIENVRSQLDKALNDLSDKELKKVLNFINEYIK